MQEHFMSIHSIEEIIEDIRLGKMVVMMDDEDRENEGDVIIAAEKVTPEAINFMARFARGLICLPITKAHSEKLRLPMMVADNYSKFGTNFTVSIEAAEGVTTGISAQDRAHTILTAANEKAKPQDIVQPGHIFPIVAQPGGVLVRAGHTEASVDLATMAGLSPSAVLCEILNEDGTMARGPELAQFAKTHSLKLGTIADLIRYRLMKSPTMRELSRRSLVTDYGTFELVVFEDSILKQSHVALVYGKPDPQDATLVRVHISDPILDIPGASLHIKDRWPLEASLKYIVAQGKGVVVLLDQAPQHGEALLEKLSQQQNAPARESNIHWRSIGIGSQILSLLNLRKIRLLGTKKHYCALSGFNLEVVEYLPFTLS